MRGRNWGKGETGKENGNSFWACFSTLFEKEDMDSVTIDS